MGTNPDLKTINGLESLLEIKAKVENEYKDMNFLLSETRTTFKDTELNLVECIAKININTPSYKLIFNTEYNAQLDDDKKMFMLKLIV